MRLVNSCSLCHETGGELIWRNASMRVVSVGDPELPGYTRVIWEDHVREMSDLSPADRAAVMNAVFVCEQAQRQVLQPKKVNLAALGNQTPHLHWHIIPRWEDDPWFPDSIWSAAKADDAPGRQVREMRRQQASDRLPEYIAVLQGLLEQASRA